ncbi:MAG: hypothetical protein ABIY55_24630 [Kofleriaceae bacterium]
MSIRSTLLTLAIGLVGAGTAAADAPKTTNTGGGGGGFHCTNGVGVGCIGTIALLPVTVNIKDVRVLDDNELTVLSDDLNNLSILDGDILDYNTILNDVEVDTLADFLDKFDINVTKNKIDVCTAVLGIQLCK